MEMMNRLPQLNFFNHITIFKVFLLRQYFFVVVYEVALALLIGL